MRILEVRRLLKEDGKLIGYSIVTDEVYNTVNSSSRYDVSIHTFERVYTIESADGSELGSEVMQLRGRNYIGRYVKGQVVYDSNKVDIDKVIDLFREDECSKYVLKYYGADVFEHKKRADGVDIATSDSVCSNNHSKHFNIDNYNIKDDKSKGRFVVESKKVVNALGKILGVEGEVSSVKSTVDTLDNSIKNGKDFNNEVSSVKSTVDTSMDVKDGNLGKLYIKIKEDIRGLLSSVSVHFNNVLDKYFSKVFSKQQDTTDEVRALREEIDKLRGMISEIPTDTDRVEIVKDRIVEIPVKETIVEVVDNTKDYSKDIECISKDIEDINITIGSMADLLKDIKNVPTGNKDTVVKEVVVIEGDKLERRDGSHNELSLEFYKTLYTEWHNKKVSKTALLKMFTAEDGVYHHLLEGKKMSKGSMYNWYDYSEALYNNGWEMSKFADIRKEVDSRKKSK